MTRDTLNPVRYRALRGGLLLGAACAVAGAVVIALSPTAKPVEWGIFLACAVLWLGFWFFAIRAHRAGNRHALEQLAQGAIAVGAAALLQRLGWDYYGALIHDPGRSLFRLTPAFLPFVYLASVTVLQPRAALRLSWVVWAGSVALILPALYQTAHFSLDRTGMAAVLTWLLLANPLFILMMSALPQYQEQIERHAAEIGRMRERTELLDKLGESERRFNLVLQSLEVGVWEAWVGPPEGRGWSPRFYDLLGYTPEELPQTEEAFKSLMHPDDRDGVWRKGLAQLKEAAIMDVDFRLKTHHRGYRWFNSRAKADYGKDGRILRMAGAITDIHDRRMANEALRMAQGELTRLAYRDTLTDQYNRRYFDEHFQREWDRAQRTGEPLALLVIDIDHFKAYNDHYGHPEGDRCLVQVASVLAAAAGRSADIVARLGGEEFAVVLPGTSVAGAEDVATRIRGHLAHATIPHPAAPRKAVTVSIGIAVSGDRSGPSPATMIEQADQALYEAKRRGRDCAFVYGSNPITRTGEHPAA